MDDWDDFEEANNANPGAVESEAAGDDALDLELIGLAEGGEKAPLVLSLQVSAKRRCYALYSKYQYSARVFDSKTRKPVEVDRLELEMNSGRGDFHHAKNNVSKLKKLEEVYGPDMCSTLKVRARATYRGQTWSTRVLRVSR